MAYTEIEKCLGCEKVFPIYNGVQQSYCAICGQAIAARLLWGKGEDADRLIAFHEGSDLLERLQKIEKLSEEGIEELTKAFVRQSSIEEMAKRFAPY
jgi:hypothetical protein